MSAKHASSKVTKYFGMPTQARPGVGRHPNPMQGPSHEEKTRPTIMGLPDTPAMNQRPFMIWKDKYRAMTGMNTWDPERPATRTGNSGGPPHRMRNFAEAKERIQFAFKINKHPLYGFNAQVPGKTPSNPSAPPGKRVLSSKFIPLETSGDGLLFIHPSQREILEWTQDQLREDAKANNRDVDQELQEKIEDVLRHDPVQPYHDIIGNRKEHAANVRFEIIRQEMKLHERRKKKGLPVPPMLMPQYAHEYPETEGGAPKTINFMHYYHTYLAGRKDRRFGSIIYSLSPDEVARMNKRRVKYMEELEEQGVVINEPISRPHETYKHKDSWDVAVERNMKLRGNAPLDAEIVEDGPMYSED
eukprot:TRINITY_DN47001_c0_g1_i1.p1 TRINITY_DN47001_c0_g1~~TRINITY_DN47001_c0_g1_i1.p1  ORF type:complete len:380 (+),score=88.15 TRINITY_DN47001_c0_g1_i1:66-1142(+)